jgi:hypothetical protein
MTIQNSYFFVVVGHYGLLYGLLSATYIQTRSEGIEFFGPVGRSAGIGRSKSYRRDTA